MDEAYTQGIVFVGRGCGTDGLDHSSCSAHAHAHLVSFSLLLVQVAQVSTHISPLVFSVGHCFSQPSPALRIQIGVIFVIGVNELVFFAQGQSRKHLDNNGLEPLDNDVQLEDAPSKLGIKCMFGWKPQRWRKTPAWQKEMIAC